MKKLESTFINMVVVLTAVTMVAVALLAWVNQLTAVAIEEAKAAKLSAGIAEVIADFDNNPALNPDTVELGGAQYIIYQARKGGAPSGVAVEASDPKGFSGPIRVLVGFDNEGTVLNYSILASQETPGLGSKADIWFKKGQRGDVTGMNPGVKPLTVHKDGGEVDAITASTITTRAFLRAVNNAYLAWQHKGTDTDAASGATNVSATSGATGKTGKENQQ